MFGPLILHSPSLLKASVPQRDNNNNNVVWNAIGGNSRFGIIKNSHLTFHVAHGAFMSGAFLRTVL